MLGQLMTCMAAMLKDYKAEIEDILVTDKQVRRADRSDWLLVQVLVLKGQLEHPALLSEQSKFIIYLCSLSLFIFCVWCFFLEPFSKVNASASAALLVMYPPFPCAYMPLPLCTQGTSHTSEVLEHYPCIALLLTCSLPRRSCLT